MTDRITGMLGLILALAYGIAGSGFHSDFITDNLGPTVFPIMLAVALGIFCLYLLIRPDPNPDWGSWPIWRNQLIAVVAMVLYATVLETLGFLLSTSLLVGFLSFMLGGPRWPAVATGVGASVVLYFLFNFGLGLPLPTGSLFGG